MSKKKPRIAFNMWPFSTVRAGGMTYYALSLLRELCKAIPERMTVFYGAHGKQLLNTVKEIRQVQSCQLEDASELYDHRSMFDVLFTPNIWSGVNMLDYPIVHVLPDIQEEYYPQFFSDFEMNARHIHHPLAARASTLLITISHYSKRTIVEKFGVPDTKVRVTHLGAHPIFSDPSNVGSRPKMLPENIDNYLFYPAHAWNHKNHLRLLDAILYLRRKYKLHISLVLTGHLLGGDANRVDIPREVEARGLRDQVFHIGTVSLHELKYLYLNALALVHPSLFEGFGIPLLEAMQSGCPIIVAEETSIPEIARDAALYFNSHDSSDIAEKIKHFLDSPSENAERVRVGKVLSREFSDRRTAEETLKILEDAYDLADVNRLKAAVPPKPSNSRRLLLSMVFFLTAPLDRKVVREIKKLIIEFNNELQFIALIPRDLKLQLDRIFKGSVETITAERTFAETIRNVSNKLKGRYVFLSAGRSLILPAFLYCLMTQDGTGDTEADLLDADSFVLDTYSGKIRDAAVPLGLDDKNRKLYSCSNLSFVVRAQVFDDLQENDFANCNSLFEVTAELWDKCSRDRVYKIVNVLFENNPESKDFKITRAIDRIHGRLRGNERMLRWLQNGIVKSCLYSTLFLYYCVPLRFRSPIGKVLRRFLRGIKSAS